MNKKQKVLEICEELCGRPISPTEELITTGMLNSFKIMELISVLEKEFQIIFLPEEIADLDNLSCIDNILSFIMKKRT